MQKDHLYSKLSVFRYDLKKKKRVKINREHDEIIPIPNQRIIDRTNFERNFEN